MPITSRIQVYLQKEQAHTLHASLLMAPNDNAKASRERKEQSQVEFEARKRRTRPIAPYPLSSGNLTLTTPDRARGAHRPRRTGRPLAAAPVGPYRRHRALDPPATTAPGRRTSAGRSSPGKRSSCPQPPPASIKMWSRSWGGRSPTFCSVIPAGLTSHPSMCVRARRTKHMSASTLRCNRIWQRSATPPSSTTGGAAGPPRTGSSRSSHPLPPPRISTAEERMHPSDGLFEEHHAHLPYVVVQVLDPAQL